MGAREGDYCTTQEAADLLGASDQRVYTLIKTGVLPAEKVNGRYRIPRQSVSALEKDRSRRTRPLSSAVMGRRLFIKGLTALTTAFATQSFYDAAKYSWEERSRSREALELFRELFGYFAIGDRTFDYSLGRPKFGGEVQPYHPDHWSAGAALAGPLGLPDIRNLKREHSHRPMRTNGDLIIFGGAGSTDETMIVWELEGPSDWELKRRTNPVLPLRWLDIADITDPDVVESEPLGYFREGQGPRRVVAWPIAEVDPTTSKRRKLWRPEPDRRFVRVEGNKYCVPHNNYLCVTRLPNILDPDFSEATPGRWPHLLVFSGGNGLGTRAAELLATSHGLEALQRAESALHGATEFQLLFRAEGIQEASRGFHRFQRLEFVDAQPLAEIISTRDYRRAHEQAMLQLAEPLPAWIAEDELPWSSLGNRKNSRP